MTKADIVKRISEKTGVDKAQVQQIVESFMESVMEAMIENKDKQGKDRGVFLRGFGSFIIKERAAKVARNVSKGTSIDIPAHSIPAFKPSKSFLAKVKGE